MKSVQCNITFITFISNVLSEKLIAESERGIS